MLKEIETNAKKEFFLPPLIEQKFFFYYNTTKWEKSFNASNVVFHGLFNSRTKQKHEDFWNLNFFQSCKAVYDRIIELRIASPQIIMNYAMFLEEQNYFEEAFKVSQLLT